MAELDREQILRDNRRICIQMEQWANASLAHRELTAIQAQILMYILSRSEQGTSLTAIHQEFGGSMAALSSMVKRLKEKGYVRVEQCAGDDRRKLLFATEKAKKTEEFLCPHHPPDSAEAVRLFFPGGVSHFGSPAKKDAGQPVPTNSTTIRRYQKL